MENKISKSDGLKKFFIITLFLIFIFLPFFCFAETESNVEINFFYSKTCPHCAREDLFLNELQNKYPEIIINAFKISENVELIKQFYIQYDVPREEWGLTPVTFIDDNYFIGFSDNIGLTIEDCIIGSIKELCVYDTEPTKQFSVPIIGEIDVSNFSPLLLSIAVGALDGFNVCAMIALGFLLTVLISTGIRKRVFWIGGTFILVSGIVYFIFIAAWLNIFVFIGYLKIITIIVSIIIILFALFLLKDYYTGVICKVCEVKKNKTGFLTKIQKQLFIKMSKLSTMEMSLFATLLGIALVAIGINMVEIVCSLGFPLAYTKILTSYGLSKSSYYFYLLIYAVFYMVDDFIIFTIAVFTMRITQISNKYFKAIKLVSGIVLLLLGIVILIKPELLTFS